MGPEAMGEVSSSDADRMVACRAIDPGFAFVLLDVSEVEGG